MMSANSGSNWWMPYLDIVEEEIFGKLQPDVLAQGKERGWRIPAESGASRGDLYSE